MELKSSIAIFQQSAETNDDTQPMTPAEVFAAAEDVAKSKGTRVVRNRQGIFVVTYSETGPFNEPHLASEWLPVQVYVLKQWASGGIRQQEMEAYYEATDPNYVKPSSIVHPMQSGDDEPD